MQKSRLWLNDFEQEMKSNIFIVPSGNYLKAEENNAESDTPESLQND